MNLTEDQAEFLMAATSHDRASLSRSHALEIDGATWIVATDGYRLHAVRADRWAAPGYVTISDVGVVEPTTAPDALRPFPVIDNRAWHGRRGGFVPMDADFLHHAGRAAGSPGEFDGPFGFYNGEAVCVFPREKPDCEIRLFRYQPWGDDRVGVSPPYLGDALRAAVVGAPVLVSAVGPLEPLVLTDSLDAPTWRAIVMPVKPHVPLEIRLEIRT